MGRGSSLNYVLEKLRDEGREIGAESSMKYALEKLREKGREIGAESSIENALDKLREKGREIGADTTLNYVLDKFREKEKEVRAENWMNYLQEKSKEWLVLTQEFGESFMKKVDQVFPPDTREEQLRHWLQVFSTFVIAGVFLFFCVRFFHCFARVVLLLCVQFLHCFCSCGLFVCRCLSFCCRFCYRFCGFFWRWFYNLFRCCFGGRRGWAVKMMKAPGRNYRMPRCAFESNPRWYFRDLRGKRCL